MGRKGISFIPSMIVTTLSGLRVYYKGILP